MLEFQEPVATIAVLEMNAVSTQSGLIEQINYAGGLWVFPGADGDRVSQKLLEGRGGLLIEIGPYSKWDSMWRECLERDFRKNDGLSKKKARRATEEMMVEWRKVMRTRLGQATTDEKSGESKNTSE